MPYGSLLAAPGNRPQIAAQRLDRVDRDDFSGTTAISGAVDSSFTLVEEKRGSGRARLTCVGRDIEYRELELRRGEENVWELVSDSREEPVFHEDRIVVLLSAFMSTRTIFIGTPTELSEKIDPDKSKGITPKKISRLILQSVEALRKTGIQVTVRRSNGKRVIELNRADSVDLEGAGKIVPIDPAAGDQTNAMLATSKEVILPRRTPELLLRPQAAQHGVSFALREFTCRTRKPPANRRTAPRQGR